MSGLPTIDDAAHFLEHARRLVAGAKEAGHAAGVDAETTALTITQFAFAMCVAEAMGPDADDARVQQGLMLACQQITQTVMLFRLKAVGK